MSFIYLLPLITSLLPEGYNSVLKEFNGIDNNYLGILIMCIFAISILSKIQEWDIEAKQAISYIWCLYLFIISLINIHEYLSNDTDMSMESVLEYLILWIIALVLLYQNISASEHLKKNKY